ncbi:MAG TPA: twin-arginine translocase TatA/TatE family subunit [Acidimicrobiales bacterium]|nr:twin-arginine translocase TatA/TatE family subunit [Acidimicrobiales bacterium]
MISFGPEKILIVLAVALIVLGPEKLPQMTRQIGKAWGDFRRFREHLEGEVRGALGEDVMPQFTPPWQHDGAAVSPTTSDGTVTQEASPSDGSASGEGAQEGAPPPDQGHPAQLPRATGSSAPGSYGGWRPDLAPDDPSLN